jgi:hypothetical protein
VEARAWRAGRAWKSRRSPMSRRRRGRASGRVRSGRRGRSGRRSRGRRTWARPRPKRGSRGYERGKDRRGWEGDRRWASVRLRSLRAGGRNGPAGGRWDLRQSEERRRLGNAGLAGGVAFAGSDAPCDIRVITGKPVTRRARERLPACGRGIYRGGNSGAFEGLTSCPFPARGHLSRGRTPVIHLNRYTPGKGPRSPWRRPRPGRRQSEPPSPRPKQRPRPQ